MTTKTFIENMVSKATLEMGPGWKVLSIEGERSRDLRITLQKEGDTQIWRPLRVQDPT